MIKTKRVAYYEHTGRQAAGTEVLEVMGIGDGRALITTPYDPLSGTPTGNLLAGGILTVEEPATGIYEVESSGRNTDHRTLAMLVNAAFQGNPELEYIITTVPRDDPERIKAYTENGFVDMGNTRDMDNKGRPLASEAILVDHTRGRLAVAALSGANISRAQILPDRRRKPLSHWDEGQ